MGKGPFKMKGPSLYRKDLNQNSPMRDEKVVKGTTYDEVEVSGGKAPTWDDRNKVMTKSELRDAKINPKPGVTYYRNTKTGQITSATSAPTTYKKSAPTKRTGGIQHFTTKERIH